MSNDDTRSFWDAQAATFDDEADHGLSDPETRDEWVALLDSLIGGATGAAVDLGCGTGSISALLALRGHAVLGIDLSPKMIEQATAKADHAGLDIDFLVGDVLTATVPDRSLSVIVSRHLLWAVPNPNVIVARWSAQLADDGVFIAVEGLWNNAGTTPERCFTALQAQFEQVEYIDLANQSVLWGKQVTDIRYAMVGRNRRSTADL